MSAHTWACGVLAGCLSLLLPACGNLPSQSNPSCSWTSQPPSNADTICQESFQTLSALAHAALQRDDTTIHKLALNPAVAARIIAFGKSERAQGLKELHVVPSLTLGSVHTAGETGVGFHLGGHRAHGSFEGSETVYVRVQGTKVVVVLDQPNQEW